jgi:hypothetical protein
MPTRLVASAVVVNLPAWFLSLLRLKCQRGLSRTGSRPEKAVVRLYIDASE